MKYLIVILVITGLLAGAEIHVGLRHGRSKAYIDDGQVCNLPHRALTTRQGDVLVDSGSSYTAWTNIQSCIAFNPTIGGVEFVSRGYSPTGILNVAQTDAAFSFMVSDQVVYDASLGSARYPTSVASTDAHIGFPILDPGTATWGHMGAQHCAGGWWSSFWSSAVDLSGGIGSPRSIGVELPTGNLVFVCDNTDATIPYYTMSADLGTTVASGNLASNCQIWGIDCNGGICYVFWYDLGNLDVFYTSTTDGITWASTTQWNLTYPSPYTNNLLNFPQMAVTDAGNPILVFDILDDDDLSWPQAGKVYVSTASGATPIQVSDDTYETSWWPTIATGGNYVVVLMHVWTNGLPDSLARHDMFAATSTDNGAAWATPFNLTALVAERPGLAQLAKRLDAATGRFFYFYGVDMIVDEDPDWVVVWGPDLDPMAWYIAWDVLGIEEYKPSPLLQRAKLEVYPNPFRQMTDIRYQMTANRSQTTGDRLQLKIYNASGRVVKNVSVPTAYSILPTVISWDATDDNARPIPAGVYFVRLKAQGRSITKKIIKLE